ncbi:hypothetical protein Hamer_G030542 [Homarus americanus]|uniref:Uncharacterized protein n=1 Tax=Homarus americanus TaxID=6706 RepID=A0A8J5JHE2_HOMAM|nr:hypothetical protein Hamer_G030542 [Homarus americanus]
MGRRGVLGVIVWTMLDNLDLKHSKTHQPIMYRSPFLELDMFTDLAAERMVLRSDDKIVETTPDPHGPSKPICLSLIHVLLLQHYKVIVYLTQESQDVVTSYYHHCRITKLANYKELARAVCSVLCGRQQFPPPVIMQALAAREGGLEKSTSQPSLPLL